MGLKEEIEKERKRLDEMLERMPMEEALAQSRKLDGLLEEYILLAGQEQHKM